MFHKVSGYIAIVYSLLHGIGHLFGSVSALSSADSIEEINEILTHKKFERKLSYVELVFTTLPGLTGMSLCVIAITMWALSLSCVRHKKWELFSYSHLLYYFFIIGMVVHGADTWLNPGFPLSSPFAAVCVVFLLLTFIRRRV